MKPMKSDANNNNTTPSDDKRNKYSLRPRNTHRYSPELLENSIPESSGNDQQQSKPAPLSRYRRKTANARERDRMREINAAFETLRRAVPSQEFAHGCSEKLTKITTLRLAMRYITELRALLDDPPQTTTTIIAPPPIDVLPSRVPPPPHPHLPTTTDFSLPETTTDLPDLTLSQDLVDLDHLFT